MMYVCSTKSIMPILIYLHDFQQFALLRTLKLDDFSISLPTFSVSIISKTEGPNFS